ncbi:unnamed protein product [Prunus brigantina]
MGLGPTFLAHLGLLLNGKWYLEEHTLGSNMDTDSLRSSRKKKKQKLISEKKSFRDCRCSVNKINNSVDALYPSWEPNSYSYGEFDAWWKA